MDEKRKHKVCFIGSGGVGTIAAIVLEKSGRAEVTTVLRSRFEIVKKKGWNIDSVDHGVLRGESDDFSNSRAVARMPAGLA
jgi:ketopantoate reductase